MARYKPCDVHQDKFIPVSFRDQILPGSFEYSLNEIVDQHIDLSPFAARYTNDETGRLAYDPSVLLKSAIACRPGANRLGFGKWFFYKLVRAQQWPIRTSNQYLGVLLKRRPVVPSV